MYAPRNLSGQDPLQWESNNTYPPRQEYGAGSEYGESTDTRAQRPPNTHSDMVPLPPQSDMYPTSDPYRYTPEHMASFSQPAPRQRTAIACNYCRRRKAQAFVPAHTAYPHLRNGGIPGRGRAIYPQNPLLYGAHGQPLEAVPPQSAYGQDQHDYRLPSPPGAQLPSPPGPYARSYDESPYEQSYRKRPHTEPHVPIPTPPLPGSPSQAGPLPPMQGRRESADVPYSEPPASAFAPSSPASSSTSYKSAYSQAPPQPPASQPPFYPTQTAITPRRSSPTSSYSYSSIERTSASPHSQGPPPGAYQFPSSATLHPPLVLPSQQSRTPPPPQTQTPGAASQQRPGMSIQNILDQGSAQSQSSRSATDSSMLNALMPRKF
ncbi:hypothetical protein FGG08_002474 [Glutinoglossum americanum]|uniref:Uncharacterized protein n=1 Tax=Glutinoglossum americanum TaxID=1670608 RepID=A0A9P8L5K4_9PEZI|nr:hypothetical protein FGG08_002474 [Glutinoglossum americanum]